MLRPSLILALLTALAAHGSLSPRPASIGVTNGVVTVTWTNLSLGHPWHVMMRNAAGEAPFWNAREWAEADGTFRFSEPATNAMKLYWLWPAAP